MYFKVSFTIKWTEVVQSMQLYLSYVLKWIVIKQGLLMPADSCWSLFLDKTVPGAIW